MTPFPETEIVTLERLEVALRNKNYNLLKEGSYKLHEKYHSGHKFEYIDRIKSIYHNVSEDTLMPNDIKDTLCSTIEDIFLDNNIDIDSLYSDSPVQNRVSSLTQLSYNASAAPAPAVSTMLEEPVQYEEMKADFKEPVEEKTEEKLEEKAPEKLSAFDVFGSKKQDNGNSYAQSPFDNNNAPFQEFKMPEMPKAQNSTLENTNMSGFSQHQTNAINTANTTNTFNQEPKQESIFNQNVNSYQEPMEKNEEVTPFEDFHKEVEKKLEDVAVFYCQNISNEKIKNILRYRELISKIQDEHHSINEILYLISEINVQGNTNILELKNILDQLRINKNKVNLITNSMSAHLIGLMEQGEYSYSLYKQEEGKQINLIPVFGLTNQFMCPMCGETYLDKEDKINPLVLQCPKCKNPMFPNFYTASNKEIQMNLDYYSNALLSLTGSDVWVVIHPILEDKVMANLIMSAMSLTSTLKKIYILDKDINIREDFKQRFLQIKNDVEINTNIGALEDFLNSIR